MLRETSHEKALRFAAKGPWDNDPALDLACAGRSLKRSPSSRGGEAAEPYLALAGPMLCTGFAIEGTCLASTDRTDSCTQTVMDLGLHGDKDQGSYLALADRSNRAAQTAVELGLHTHRYLLVPGNPRRAPLPAGSQLVLGHFIESWSRIPTRPQEIPHG